MKQQQQNKNNSENLGKNIQDIKKNQMEILKLKKKNMMTEMKKSRWTQ